MKKSIAAPRSLPSLLTALCACCLAATALQAQTASPPTPPRSAAPRMSGDAPRVASSHPATAPGRVARGPTSGPVKAESDEVAMSFDNAPIEQVCRFIGDSRNKPVLLHDSVKGKTLTIISNKKLPLKEALAILEDALRQSGIVLEESSRTIRVVPVSMIKQMTLPVVPGGTSVSTIADDGKIVDKIFVLKHYEVAKVKEIILPMLSIGHVTCDTGTRTLVVADTVGTLKRIEQTIAILDVPASEQSRTEIIQVEKGDAAEIVSVVTSLLKGLGRDVKDVTTATPARGDSPPSQGPGPMRPEMMGMSSRGGPGPGGPPSPGGGGPEAASAGAGVQRGGLEDQVLRLRLPRRPLRRFPSQQYAPAQLHPAGRRPAGPHDRGG